MAASKTWPVVFRLYLTNSIDGLRNFVEANALAARARVLEAELARARQMAAAGVVEDQSASLEAELAEARQVAEALQG